MEHGFRRRTAICCALLVPSLALAAAGCTGRTSTELRDASGLVSYNVSGDGVDPGETVQVTVRKEAGDRITGVRATDGSGRPVEGELAGDGTAWRSTSALASQARYTLRVTTVDASGARGAAVHEFRTARAGNLLDIALGPAEGLYGVGQPVTAQLSAPVEDRRARAVVERGLEVTSRPAAAQGSWHWVDDRTLHYRPRTYWPAHATVRVRAQLGGARVTGDLYAGPDPELEFRTGARTEAVIDAASHTMKVVRDGKVLRTFPVTTGKPGFETRNGVKVVLAQEPFVRMTGASIGIPEDSPESYDLPVEWAVRVTWSGEYVHAAPWSVAAQGVANVSHGCTGMSTEDARWYFHETRPGDIVRVVNSGGGEMEPFGNGFGDWNLEWQQWLAGSALGGADG